MITKSIFQFTKDFLLNELSFHIERVVRIQKLIFSFRL